MDLEASTVDQYADSPHPRMVEALKHFPGRVKQMLDMELRRKKGELRF
jgi:hypothetical protein